MTADTGVTVQFCDCITPLGNSLETWRKLCDGVSNIRQYPLLGDEGGATVPLSLFEAMSPELPPRWIRHVTEMLNPVAGPEWGRADTPVFIASSNFGVDSLYYFRHENRAEHLPYAVPHDSVEQIRLRLGWSRNISLFSHACVSSHIAILAATAAIKAGASKALVVSYDFISPFVTGGFNALKILNGAMPKPYHDGPTGSIALGEGAGYAILTGSGKGLAIRRQSTWNEMHHFTANDPTGIGFAKVVEPISDYLKTRRFWIKGHGTGTLEAGKLETCTLKTLFPDAPLVGWKGAIGHTLGSCGLVELAIAARAMENGTVPGTVGGENPCFADNVSLTPFDAKPYDAALILSNAFGGAQAGLVLCHD
jgi:3-oxoacyl-(acyl-carrier-protein) synthase